MSADLRVEIDYDLCANAENCLYAAPGTFRVEDGRTVVIEPPGDDESTVVDAAIGCPMQAIVVRDAATGADLRP